MIHDILLKVLFFAQLDRTHTNLVDSKEIKTSFFFFAAVVRELEGRFLAHIQQKQDQSFQVMFCFSLSSFFITSGSFPFCKSPLAIYLVSGRFFGFWFFLALHFGLSSLLQALFFTLATFFTLGSILHLGSILL